jgi:hypothetical protein
VAATVTKASRTSEAELAVVVEARGIYPLHVLLAMRGDESVVRVGRLPAVDDQIPAGSLDVAEELRADEAASLSEERGPLAIRSVDALELRRVVARPRS